MRGKETNSVYNEGAIWITPAHAGKSRYAKRIYHESQDHPRTCGEKADAKTALEGKGGSPPHMRGKVMSDGLPSCYHGITPAHAGKRFPAERA